LYIKFRSGQTLALHLQCPTLTVMHRASQDIAPVAFKLRDDDAGEDVAGL
jgi:hypothetical protein